MPKTKNNDIELLLSKAEEIYELYKIDECEELLLDIIIRLNPTYKELSIEISDPDTVIGSIKEMPTSKVSATHIAKLLLLCGNVISRKKNRDMLSVKYYNEAVKYTNPKKNELLYAQINNEMGTMYRLKGEIDTAIHKHFDALRVFEILNNENEIAHAKSNIAEVYKDIGRYKDALDYLYEVQLYAYKSTNKIKYAGVLVNIGAIFKSMRDSQTALGYYYKALAIFEEMQYRQGLAVVIGNIGSTTENQNEARKCLFCAFELFRQLDMKYDEARILGSIGLYYASLCDYDNAMIYFQKSLRNNKALGRKKLISHSYHNIGVVYCLQEYSGFDLKKSEYYIHSALKIDEEVQNYDHMIYPLRALAEVYERQGRWELCSAMYKRCDMLKEEVRNHHLLIDAKNKEFEKLLNEKEMERKSAYDEVSCQLRKAQEQILRKSLELTSYIDSQKRMRLEIEDAFNQSITTTQAIQKVKKLVEDIPESAMNWQKFYLEFQVVYPDYQRKIYTRIPALTQAEFRVSCMILIGLHTTDIATMLFISERTVERHRLHLRHKLNISTATSLQSVLASL
ncbi:MAG: LuxR family transcriptional regulator [Candidatus Kapaibacterium sp.]|nr:LuxR family transcriptional regulator [Bacteroidota bacterium]